MRCIEEIRERNRMILSSMINHPGRWGTVCTYEAARLGLIAARENIETGSDRWISLWESECRKFQSMPTGILSQPSRTFDEAMNIQLAGAMEFVKLQLISMEREISGMFNETGSMSLWNLFQKSAEFPPKRFTPLEAEFFLSEILGAWCYSISGEEETSHKVFNLRMRSLANESEYPHGISLAGLAYAKYSIEIKEKCDDEKQAMERVHVSLAAVESQLSL
jgi:hypothetical protein